MKRPMSLMDMINANADRRDEQEEKPPIDPEAAVMRLREAATRYREMYAGPRFAVGDLVTPVRDGLYQGAGQPHVVVHVVHEPSGQERHTFSSDVDTGSPTFGVLFDMRVITLTDDHILPYWVQSADYEAWSPTP